MQLNYYKNEKLSDKILYFFIIFIIISTINYFAFQVLFEINLIAFTLEYSLLILTIIGFYLFDVSSHKQEILRLNQELDKKKYELKSLNEITSENDKRKNQEIADLKQALDNKIISNKTLLKNIQDLSETNKSLKSELETCKERIDILTDKKKIKNINTDNTDNTDNTIDNADNNEILINKKED